MGRDVHRVDPLTGVWTRYFLQKRLEELVDVARSRGVPFALLMADLDNFKTINDTYGHEAGDRVLVAWTRLLRHVLRPGDEIIRYGGDEFVIILPHTTRDEAREISEKILHTLRHTLVDEYQIGVSLGLAAYPTDSTDPYELFALADQALYQAKNRGKFQVATPDRITPQFTWPVPFVSRTSEERALQRALEGSCPIVLVTGPAGSGKSRLISQVLQRFPERWIRISAYHYHQKSLEPFHNLLPNVSGSLEAWKRALIQAVPQRRLLVENAQWLDTESWNLLFLLTIEGFRLILTLREEDYAPLLARHLHQAFRLGWVEEVHVDRLGYAQVELLVRRALQARPPHGLVQDMHTLSGGLPHLVGEILRGFLQEGILVRRKTWRYTGYPPGFTPRGLMSLWRYRTRNLSPEARKLLGLMGLLGGYTTPDHLSRFPGMDLAMLDELVQASLLTVDEGRVVFREGIWAGFAVQDLPEDERRAFARALLDHIGNTLSPTQRVWLAFHADRPQEGWELLVRVLQDARRRGDPREIFQVLHLRRGPVPPWCQSAVLHGEAWACRYTGDHDRALRILEQHRNGDPDLARLWLDVLIARGEFQRAVEESLRLERHFTSREARWGLALERVWALINLGQYAQAQRLLYPLLNRIPRKHPDRARALNFLGQLRRFSGSYRGAHRAFSRALEIYRDLGDLRGEAAIYTNWSLVYIDQDRFAEAEALLKRAMDLYETLDYPEGKIATMGNLSLVYADLGYAQSGVHLLQDAIELSLTTGFLRALPFFYRLMGVLLSHMGETERARGYAQRALEEARNQGVIRAQIQAMLLMARIHAMRGDHQTAWEILEAGEVLAARQGLPRDTFWWLYERMALATVQKDWETLRAMFPRLRDLAEEASRSVRLYACLVGAQLAAMEGNEEEAYTWLERARRSLSRIQSAMLYGVYHMHRGEVEITLGHRDRGIRDLQRAREVFRNLELHHWAREAEALLEHSAGERDPSIQDKHSPPPE